MIMKKKMDSSPEDHLSSGRGEVRRIYLDHASTTPVDPVVEEAMKPFLSKSFGNASSLHSFGREAKQVLEKSRENIARKLGAIPEEIIFTSGGTESNNLALKGIAFANREKGKHIIISRIEHSCILNSCRWLEKEGFEVEHLNVDREGFIDLKELENSIRKDTILVSIIHGNNEIGTIQNLDGIGKICSDRGVYFHTDACQSFTKVPLNVKKQNLDLVTINSHKIYGPKGVGALFIRKGTRIEPWQHGGGHEFNLRSGTENIPGIVGFAKASEITGEREIQQMMKLRNRLVDGILDEIPDSWLNGPRENRLCNNANISFNRIDGNSLLHELDRKGISVSTASACSSHSREPSHVLRAIGLTPEEANGSIRITVGKENTTDEIDFSIESIKELVEKLRNNREE